MNNARIVTYPKANRQKIVKVLADYEENDFAKIFDKDYFYFNKQAIQLTNLGENGQSFEEHLPTKTDRKTGEVKRTKSLVLKNLNAITFEDKKWMVDDLLKEGMEKEAYEDIKEFLKNTDYKEQSIKLHTENTTYHYDADKMTIVETANDGSVTELGNGKLIIKASYKKATKTKPSKMTIKAELTPDYEKDYEVIPYSRNEEENNRFIDDFLAKYIFKPFIKLDCKVGVEINFNKVFYQPEVLRPIADIKSDIAKLDKQLADLEKELNV